ncbi:MAG: hypothetical protein AABX89_03550 [Candidatus Thermoplasmatota archaeon]
MKSASIVAVSLLVALLAGCVGGGGATAKGLLSIADNAANAWDADAQLVSVFGIEANITIPPAARMALQEAAKEDARADPEALVALLSDARVGDGVAPGWVYAYFSPKGVYGVIVGADRQIIFEEQVANITDIGDAAKEIAEFDLEAAFGAWNVDSDTAAANVAAANATFAAQVGKSEQVLAWFINPVERTWEMVLTPLRDGMGIHATVDYESGEVKRVELNPSFGVSVPGVETPETPVVEPQPDIDQEAGAVNGRVSTLATTDGGSFDIDDLHDVGRLLISAQEQAGAAGLSDVTVTVTGPDGEEYSTTLSPMLGTETIVVPFTPAVGEWQVVMTSGGVALGTSVTVEWCTDGDPTPDTLNNGACQDLLGFGGSAGSASPLRSWLPFAAAP